MIIGRGGNNTKALKMVYENLEEPIYITTPKELEETLYKLVDEVNPFNAKISLDLIKDTHFGRISI